MSLFHTPSGVPSVIRIIEISPKARSLFFFFFLSSSLATLLANMRGQSIDHILKEKKTVIDVISLQYLRVEKMHELFIIAFLSSGISAERDSNYELLVSSLCVI